VQGHDNVATFYTTGMEHSPTSVKRHRMGAHEMASGQMQAESL